MSKPEFNHSQSPSVEFENMWCHNSTLSIRLLGMEWDNILLFLHSAVTGLRCLYSHIQTGEGAILKGVSQICEHKGHISPK